MLNVLVDIHRIPSDDCKSTRVSLQTENNKL